MARGATQPYTEYEYFVHPSEGPNSLTVSPKLNGSNYLAWKRSMQCTLGTKNKLGFINGNIPVPDRDDLLRSAWERCNHLVQSWIINSLSESIAQIVVSYDSTLEIWQDLHERFCKVDRIRIANLRSSINSLKQGKKPVIDYFTELKALWEEFSSHRPIPNYVCIHHCRCDATKVAKNHRNEDQIMQFLTGLNENFSVVKTQILLLHPLPTLNKVYSLVIQEESNSASILPINVGEDTFVQLNASDARRFSPRGKTVTPNNSNKPARYCTFCHRNNHTVDFCYEKHGYPNGNKPQPRSNNMVQAKTDDNTSSASLNASTSSTIGISQEQYAQLVSLLQQASLVAPASTCSGPASNIITVSPPVASSISANEVSSSGIPFVSPPTTWIIDSGANEHISCTMSYFSAFYRIKPVKVTLPNGTSLIVSFAGTISFTSQFHLHHVLYSPHFHLNLIYVAIM